jgi:hypothetical protein
MNGVSRASRLTLAANLTLLVLLVYWAFWPVKKLQTLDSPDGLHTVELLRADHIDRNYSVKVDGVRVFTSPDFAPNNRVPFRETLFWDATGKIVVLEVARQRVYGYDVSRRRALSDAELLAVVAASDPPLWEYGYEWEWPGVGRARRDAGKP